MGFNDFWINNNGKKEQLNNTKHGVRKEQVDKKFHNLFDAYDVNGDGTLESEELEGIVTGLTKFSGTDKTLDSVENKQVSSLFKNQAGIKDADFMGFVKSVSDASEEIVLSSTSKGVDGSNVITTTYKNGMVETIYYYPDGEFKLKTQKQDSVTESTTYVYTNDGKEYKQCSQAELDKMIKADYKKYKAANSQNSTRRNDEFSSINIIMGPDVHKSDYMKRHNVNPITNRSEIHIDNTDMSERAKAEAEIRDFVISHFVQTHKDCQSALDTMGILDDIGAAINAGAGELWNSCKNIYNKHFGDGTESDYQNFYELVKKFEPNYGKALVAEGSLAEMRVHPVGYFTGETGKIDVEKGLQFQQTTERYQNATILKARIDILKDAMLEISMYENEQNALTYAPAQSEGMNPASHILKANNLLLQYFDGDKEAVNMLLNGTIGNAQSTINAIKGIADDTQKMFDTVTNGKSFDEIKNDYQTQYKAIYGTDFVPDELTEKVMDAKATGGMVKLAAITAISILITKSPVMAEISAAAGGAEVTGATANMIRTLASRYGATAVQKGIKFAMTSGTLAREVGLTLLNQVTSERGVDGEELWESTKGSAKYIYFGAYIGSPLAQAVSKQLGKIGATARMFDGGVKSANGAIQTTSITGNKLVQNLMKGGNKVLTTGGAFLTDVAAFSALEVATEGMDPLTAGKEQTEMLGKLKIMNHFIEYMLGGKVHAGMSKAQMDATIERSGVKNWQIKEIKAPNKTVYEVEVSEGLPPMRFEDKNQLATAMLERVTANYSEGAKSQTRTQTTKPPEGEVKVTPETEVETETARPESRINIPAGKFEAPNAKFAETDDAFRSIVTKRFADIKELDKISDIDEFCRKSFKLRYCKNEDGSHNAQVGNKLIDLLKDTKNSRLISAIAEIAKSNDKHPIDPRFFDALEDAKNRGVHIESFDLILKECTDVEGKFSQEIYNKIYELRDAQIWEGGIPQILKACKNNDGTFNNDVFQAAFKLKEMEHNNGVIGFILQASKDLNGNFSQTLLDRIHKEIYNWASDDFPKVIQSCLNEKGTLDEVAYDNLRKLQATGRMSNEDIVRIAPLFKGLSEYLGKNNINELSIAEKRNLLKKLVSFNAMLFDKQFELAKESLNLNTRLIPTSKEEYCALLPKLVKSIGIDTKPLSHEVESKCQASIDALSKEDGVLAKTDFNTGDIKLELAYPRETFISDMNNLLNELPPLERVKAMDYFGFEIKNRSDNVAQMNGYPINVNNGAKMSEISEPATRAVIEKMRPYVERFTNQNYISIKDNPALAEELNNIVKAFPEFLTTIGRKQHGTHDFTIDVHTLKVLQGVITNPRFQQLPSADRKILQIATLMHDLTKAEGLVDKIHPQYSAYDTYYLLEKMNLSESDKLKIYQLIKNHDWLERLNTAGRNTEAVARDIAFDLREGNLFEMASILAEADLKGVKKGDSFYLKYQAALDRGNEKIKGLVDEIQKSSIYLPQTKIPKASELKVDGEKVKIEMTKDSNGNPISNTVIYLDKDMDLSALGFTEGLKGSDLNVLVHALNYENQSAIFQALGQVDSDALLSSSYITYNKGNYHVFRTQGFILDVASTDIHAGTYMDFGSGCGKDMQTLKSQYLFNGYRKKLRNFFSDEFKEMLNLTDEEYLKLYNEIANKSITELDQSHPEVAKKIREMFDSMEIHKRSHGRDYNEILISRPQIQGVFWQGKVKDSDAEKHLGKKYTIDRVPEFLRKYAADNDLPIIYFGE